ncbi:probable phospholipid phosphatase 6 [Coccomyxa sp. Obi]|nr:probable phospholipid phosphatase 6 [Coccomyxa sp. Obi]
MSNQKLVQPDRRNALVDLDTRLSLSLYRSLGSKVPRSVFKTLEHTGSGLLWLPLAPVVFLAPSASPVLRTCAANLLVGLLVDIAIVGTLKGLVRRARPVYNDTGDFLLVVAVDSFSFPSGHAARAMFLALYALLWLSGDQLPWALPIMLWGLVTAFSRCLMGRHFLGDVLAGLLVGVLTTAVITKGTFSLEGLWISSAQADTLHGKVLDHLQSLTSQLRW